MSELIPFPIGSIVRVKDPDCYLVEFSKKIKDRDAIVKDILLDWVSNTQRGFNGRLLVEFQKRGNRGKTFTEVFHQRNLILKESP